MENQDDEQQQQQQDDHYYEESLALLLSVPSDVANPTTRSFRMQNWMDWMRLNPEQAVAMLLAFRKSMQPYNRSLILSSANKKTVLSASHHGHKRMAILYWEALLGLLLSAEDSKSEHLSLLKRCIYHLSLTNPKRALLPGWFKSRMKQPIDVRQHLIRHLSQFCQVNGNAHVDVAAVLGAHLDNDGTVTWKTFLLQDSISTLRPPVFFIPNMDDAFWKEEVLPSLLLKLKSHSSTSVHMIQAWIRNCPQALHPTSLGETLYRDWVGTLINKRAIGILEAWMTIPSPDCSLVRDMAAKHPGSLRHFVPYSDAVVVSALLSTSDSSLLPTAAKWVLALRDNRAEVLQASLAKWKAPQLGNLLHGLIRKCDSDDDLKSVAKDMKGVLNGFDITVSKKITVDHLYIWYFESLATQRPSKRLTDANLTMDTSDRYCEILPRIVSLLPNVSECAVQALARVCVQAKAPVQSLETIVATHGAIKSSLIKNITLELEGISEQLDAAVRLSINAPNSEEVSPRILPGNFRSIEHVGNILDDILLLHVGSSTDPNRLNRPQRRKLICATRRMVPTNDISLIQTKGSILQAASRSALLSLGAIAGDIHDDDEDKNGDHSRQQKMAHEYCVQRVGPALAQKLSTCIDKICSLSKLDVEVYRTKPGELVKTSSPQKTMSAAQPSKRRTEEEEWEEQMRRELQDKKTKEPSNTLSSEDRATLKEQEEQRSVVKTLVETDFWFTLQAIQSLCGSDIEVGNECLLEFADIVSSAVVCRCELLDRMPKYRNKVMETLVVLGTCVYEIEEKYARSMAIAISVCCSVTAKETKLLPSHCEPVAIVLKQLDDFQDALSGSSFTLIFPILRACLTGPRTPIDCEKCLAILDRQTSAFFGELRDENVVKLRKDMVGCVLELLKHDRYQTFHDPTAFEALVHCYTSDRSEDGKTALTAAELAPLLDDRGALGEKHCRMGAMMALEKIAEDHPKLLKVNPLAENRVLVNCFDSDETLRTRSRKAWCAIRGVDSIGAMEDLPKPSAFYANPLIPLLSHENDFVRQAAADSFAFAVSKHPASTERSVELLCTTYIDAFPLVESKQESPLGSPFPSMIAPVPTKKKIATGLPKKKGTAKKSALEVAGIGRPKPSSKKKTAMHAAMLKPKQERTLDQASLANQFKASTTTETITETDSPAKVKVRLGILSAFAAMSKPALSVSLDESSLKLVTSFLMAYGIADSDDSVKNAARNTLRDMVASNGGSNEAIAFLLPLLEIVLKSGVGGEGNLGSLPTNKVPTDVHASDRRKEGAVVALGSVALHLKGPENYEKVDSTVDMLIAALDTPSEEVQLSVAEALTKLMKKGRTQDRVEVLINSLLDRCLGGASLAIRRGSAYGLAAAVKGSGIASLKKYDVVKTLEQSCLDGDSSRKEGALFAVELLSSRLGLLFEPYVIVLLPSLLKSFSDGSDYVRKAANHTAGLIMSKLSAHGVKLVLPAVLTAFEDGAWRTKQASIQMLGSMSQLAPKQLASALPKVVPRLTEAFSDTHPKVKASAEEALDEITAVVKNPEVSSISGKLLKALTDPADYTIKALEILIQTEFLHAIDAPSLALIIPILHRGLRDRGASAKRYSGLIAGNISTMINDPKDLVPYLPTLLPDLQSSLLDPIPDVRSTSAKALGSLTRSLGEHIVLELRPWLMKGLRTNDCTAAERSGAAQGLTEVLIASGSTMVEDAMREEILPLRNHPEPSTREGVLWMLSFLPPAMGQGFTSLIDVSLPAIISGLSDDSEPVRDVALRAGRVLIRSHGKVHVDRVLPSLEEGLTDDDHRIRVASLSLLGDLLAMIGGIQISRTETNTQDDIRRAERAQAQIALSLGTDTRKRVLSGLYMARSDSVHMVRQIAIQVWKTIVSVTARTLRDILPVLVSKIISNLASGNLEKTEVAGRCLGDLVSKLGDSVMPQIMPVLRKSLDGGDENTKRGVCVGLTEVIKCSTKDQILRYIEIIVKVVQDALSTDDDEVRAMAAASFQSLHAVVGGRAMDEIVPSIMVALENGEEDPVARAKALNGLTGILSVRSRELLPYILPRLIKRPITTNHAEVIAGVAKVSKRSIHSHFSTIIPALLKDMAELEDGDEQREEAIRGAAKAICSSVDPSGVNILVSEIVSKCSNDKPSIRRESCTMFGYIASERAKQADFYDQIPVMLREMLYRLNDENAEVVKANHAALSVLSKQVPAEELVNHVEFMKNLLASLVSDARRRKGGVGDGEFLLPGFNIPKGLEPLVPIYQRGIVYGSPAIRETSATGLGEAMDLTAAKYLAGPMIVKLTGPLLRVVGDRNPSSVKIAILKTLERVLTKGGPTLRAFVPQFQTTFVKALQDPSRQVRLEAIAALSMLMGLSTRVDPLIKELVNGASGKSVVDDSVAAAAIQTATLEALATVLREGGTKAKTETSIPSALETGVDLLFNTDEGMREGAAKVIGEACALMGPEKTNEVISDIILSTKSSSVESRHGKSCAIRWILVSKAGEFVGESVLSQLQQFLLPLFEAESESVREASLTSIGAVIGRSADPKKAFKFNESVFKKIMSARSETLEISRAVARAICTALEMIEASGRIDTMGLSLLNACLDTALKSSQRVQFAFNDVLWLALDGSHGDAGLEYYCSIAMFENQRSMKTLFTKVLSKIKEVTVL